MLDFCEIQLEGHATEGDLDAMLFNSPSFNLSKMADVQTSEVNAKLTPLRLGSIQFCMMIDLQKMNNFNITIFVRKKYERGRRFKFTIYKLCSLWGHLVNRCSSC
jgi:hypothetical protein